MIKIYDTMTRSLRDFVPLTENVVNMYVCGPTVYNYIHIGNARSAVAFDTIRRYFEYCGYTVNYISNFTDVDDKIIKAANEAGISTKELSDKFIAAFMEDTGQLGIKPATQNPRVINYMDEIITFVSTLVDKGFAYVSEGDVYFRVAKSNNYAKLANKTLEDLEIGASGRTDAETERKENPLDFALWKAAKEGEVSWDSPWGPGRPGWHIECSVMATEILGDTIDIHGGGADLEFPHHTNEIAQSEAKTGKTFANYWMHNGFVNVDNEKMSKSLGNFVTVHDMLQTVDGQVLRFFLATQQYRKPINFTEKAIHDAEVNLKYLKNTHSLPLTEQVNQAELQTYLDAFQEAMDDDFNTANGVTVLFDMAEWINSGHYDQTVKDAFEKILQVFGIVFEETILDILRKEDEKYPFYRLVWDLLEEADSRKLGLWHFRSEKEKREARKYVNQELEKKLKRYFGNNKFLFTVQTANANSITSYFIKNILSIPQKHSFVMFVVGKPTKGINEVLRNCKNISKELDRNFSYYYIDYGYYGIKERIEERQAARANKDFATADRIRDELAAKGIKLLDTKEGLRWTRD